MRLSFWNGMKTTNRTINALPTLGIMFDNLQSMILPSSIGQGINAVSLKSFETA